MKKIPPCLMNISAHFLLCFLSSPCRHWRLKPCASLSDIGVGKPGYSALRSELWTKQQDITVTGRDFIHPFSKNSSECVLSVRTVLHTKMVRMKEDGWCRAVREQSYQRGRSEHTLRLRAAQKMCLSSGKGETCSLQTARRSFMEHVTAEMGFESQVFPK